MRCLVNGLGSPRVSGLNSFMAMGVPFLAILLVLGSTTLCDPVYAESSVVVSVPDTSGTPGSNVVVPVSITDVTGLGVYGALFMLRYDGAVLAADSVFVGALTSGWWIAYTTHDLGDGDEEATQIGLAGTNALVGAGTFVRHGGTDRSG